ncbi:MAG TPA: thioredoxin family protein [Pseudogracilibacillus sp.]|nr:thioredoxin family protein [Pseudogracilibacillus sp.]
MLKKLTSMQEVNEFMQQDGLQFLYVTMPNCSVCHGLLPQLEPFVERYSKINFAQLDAADIPEAQGQFQLFTAPVALLFVDGKEYIRQARFIPLQQLDEDIYKIYSQYFQAE